MDREVVEALEKAGVPVDRPDMLRVGVQLDDQRKVTSVGEVVTVVSEKKLVQVRLKPISQLFTGSQVPPDFSRAPPESYHPFFILLESAAADCCKARGRPEPDAEFERLYRQLRRRPDGDDANPAFSYLQAAARLYMSLRDTSLAEFDAVADRLHRSARTLGTHTGSTNYYREVLQHLFGAP
ncbi:hypothetical protein P2318_03785 [Myxococcaceae bacterium GXIMD 01537]